MIGFFGGSFDPVHRGHLENAQMVKDQLSLTQLFLMPCANPVHKDGLLFSNTQRLEMLELVADDYGLEIDQREIQRNDASYTINSLKEIRDEYPDQAVVLVIGADSFAQFSTWKDYQEFHHYCHLLVIDRPQASINKTQLFNFQLTDDRDVLTRKNSGCIYFTQGRMLDISSSAIRGKIARAEDLSALLPEKIINYLQTQ